MKAVIFGNREFGCVCVEELLALEVQIPLVVTYPPDPREAPGHRSLAEVAREAGLAVATPPDASGRPLLDWVRGVSPDVLFSFYYGHRLPRTLRAAPSLGAFNLHAALLPRWRGRSPIPFVLLEGEEQSGVTLHEMVEELDAGPIAGQIAFPVAERETATTLYQKSLAAARLLLRRTVPLLREGRVPHEEQDASKATVTPTLLPRRTLDRRASVERFDRTVRAMARPYRGARLRVGGEFVIIREGRPTNVLGPEGLPVALADGIWLATLLAFPGGDDMDAATFREGHPDLTAALAGESDDA
jgi:UDP-4-amino-4-deoxy-L-arabinose formyltransferase/UDP-glucuronic acid dehydrogenase (UDP-4-keto-hexauronic acid decarboxylating)